MCLCRAYKLVLLLRHLTSFDILIFFVAPDHPPCGVSPPLLIVILRFFVTVTVSLRPSFRQIAHWAYRHKTKSGLFITFAEWYKSYPLHQAVRDGYVDTSRILLQQQGGEDQLEARNSLGRTPLETARLFYSGGLAPGLGLAARGKAAAEGALPNTVEESIAVGALPITVAGWDFEREKGDSHSPRSSLSPPPSRRFDEQRGNNALDRLLRRPRHRGAKSGETVHQVNQAPLPGLC